MALTWPHDNDYVLGAGYISFAPEVSSTTEGTAFRYLGETSNFSIGGASEILTADSFDSAVAEEKVRIVKKVTRESVVTLRDVDEYNLSLFVMGSANAVSQSTGTVTGLLSAVTKGRYYKLGTDALQDIGTTSLKLGSSTGTSLTVTGGDYLLDTDWGVVYFATGGAATGNVWYSVAKTNAAWTRVDTGTTPVYGTLQFISNNTVGDNRRVKISRCMLSPNGQAEFKSRDNFMELSMNINILTRGTTPQVQIFGKAV